MKRYLVIGAMALAACHSPNKSTDQKSTVEKKYAEKGKIEVMDPAMLKYVAQDTKVEILAEGFKWSEGPLWIENGKYLLFSDIPPNKVMKWSEKDGLTEYLHPAGYTGTVPREGEPGSNGLILDNQGRLVMCHHGDRRM